MARKKVADMSPDELESYRAYMRQKKRESRAKSTTKEIDKRTYSDRKEYFKKRRSNRQA